MPVGRYARHTRPVQVAKTRHVTKEIPIMAEDMYGRPPGAVADPTLGVTGQSIRWRFDPATRQGVCADVKLPVDRAPGTSVKFYFVYSIPTGPGGGDILWRLDYVVAGKGELVTPSPTVRTVLAWANAADLTWTSGPIVVSAAEFDGKAQPIELQLGIIRYADDAGDTEASEADLYKVVMEYTAEEEYTEYL